MGEVELEEIPPSSSDLQNNESSSDEESDEEEAKFKIEVDDFLEVLGRAKDICDGVTDKDELNWECLNTGYFMSTLNQANTELSEEEFGFMKQLDYALKQDNPKLEEDLEKFSIIVDLWNICIDRWEMLKKKDKELKYKIEPGVDEIKIFDAHKLKTKLITVDILWCLTENSPAKYLKPHLQISDAKTTRLQEVAMKAINHTLKTLGDPQVNENSFKLSKCCLCNC